MLEAGTILLNKLCATKKVVYRQLCCNKYYSKLTVTDLAFFENHLKEKL